jgi:hypothetical protein
MSFLITIIMSFILSIVIVLIDISYGSRFLFVNEIFAICSILISTGSMSTVTSNNIMLRIIMGLMSGFLFVLTYVVVRFLAIGL